MKKTLIIFGHRTPSESIFGKKLFESTIELASVTRRVLLDEYPTMKIDGDRERDLLISHENITTSISMSPDAAFNCSI